MNYGLLYTEKAAHQLERLPEEVVDAVERQLLELAESPVELSIPIASPPFPPRGQLYHFEIVDSVGDLWCFTVIFRYSQDESSLHILSVTWREMIEQ